MVSGSNKIIFPISYDLSEISFQFQCSRRHMAAVFVAKCKVSVYHCIIILIVHLQTAIISAYIQTSPADKTASVHFNIFIPYSGITFHFQPVSF